MRIASASQSYSTSLTFCVLPEVAPLFQYSLRDLLQNQVVFVSNVRRTASASTHASMRTSFVEASWTIAGRSPRSSKARSLGSNAASLSRFQVVRERVGKV